MYVTILPYAMYGILAAHIEILLFYLEVSG